MTTVASADVLDLASVTTADAGRWCEQCGLTASRHPVEVMRGDATVFYCCTGCQWVAQLIGDPKSGARAKGTILRLGVALFFGMNTMVFSLAHYGNLLGDDQSSLGALRLMDVQRWAQLVFTIPVMVLLGGPTLARLADLRRGRPAALDGLVALGATTAFVTSVWNTLRGAGDVYFDTAAMLLIFITLGKALEASARVRARRQWDKQLEAQSDTYSVLRDREVALTTEQLVLGDHVRVEAGQQIPVDGVVLEGRAWVRSDWLTGESQPRAVGVDEQVLAGSIATDASLTVRATSTGSNCRKERLRRLLDDARGSRPPLVNLGDRMAGVLLVVALVVAVVAFGLGWREGGAVSAISRTVAALVVACPCAMGIAAPLAFWNAWSAPAAQGIWLRSPEVVERLAQVSHVVFDKTGTLTQPGRENIAVDLLVEGWSKERVLGVVSALEKEVRHPLAEVLRAPLGPVTTVFLDDVRAVPGRGVTGVGAADFAQGHAFTLGSRRFMTEEGMAGLPSPVETSDHELFLACEGRIVARILLEERIRFGAGPAMRGLRSLGVSTELMSGDHEPRVRATANQLHIGASHGGVLPEQKLQKLRDRAGAHHVAMVGDGMNDAPAMAGAWVGIALAGATDLTRSAAHVTAIDASPAAVPALIRHARKARRVVLQNFAWAIAYNGVALFLAATGHLQPMMAAMVMLLSSFTVTLSSRRAGAFPRLPREQSSEVEPAL